MFGISFFSNKVANAMIREFGYDANDVRELWSAFGGMRGFKELCDGLKANGYDAVRAAGLFHRLHGTDRDAFEELYNNSGLAGRTILGPARAVLESMDDKDN